MRVCVCVREEKDGVVCVCACVRGREERVLCVCREGNDCTTKTLNCIY